MWDRRMIGVPNGPGRETLYIELPAGWNANAFAPSREVEVGGSQLTRVAVLSALEASRINEAYRTKAAEALLANVATRGEEYITRHLDERAVQGAAEVDRLLEAIREEGYFSSWVLIEECTID